ncbi:tRNA pseudouridine(38-40) synthase TruA [filamentous cyanobacterium CCP5]|nr:tRNA pseudouridine(38-40) synthase TruA [filamentous cyanobacterium CCP5]
MSDSSLNHQLNSESTGKWTQTHRVALVVQYVGTNLHGWQRQPKHRSVQGDLEAAIAEVLGRPVTIYGAGRTDSGVHAAAQVAHFVAPSVIPAHRWRDILNSRLSKDILVRATAAVPDSWHAQFSARWRRYRYTLYTDPLPNLFLRPYVWHYYYDPINVQAMQAALDPMVGHHDFAAFHRARSGRSHSYVEIQAAECRRRGSIVTVEIQSSGFLYGMVRLIMGLLVEVGRKQMSPDTFDHIWRNQQRSRVKYSAPAQGLCLLRVGYDHFPFEPEVWVDAQPHFALKSVPAAV